jgi:anti-anti-sigma factor
MTVLSWPSSLAGIAGRVLYLDGRLWTPVPHELRHRVKELVHRGERCIVVDLARVSSIDAAGVGELVRAYNIARAADGTLRVANASLWVRDVIERAGLGPVLLHDRATVSCFDAIAH